MGHELKGILIVKEDEQQISASFKKREFVIEVVNERNTEWNDFIKIQLTQDRCALIDTVSLGDELNVSVNIKGRKWEKDGKVSYFNSIEAWKIEKINQLNAADYANSAPPPEGNNVNDMPF